MHFQKVFLVACASVVLIPAAGYALEKGCKFNSSRTDIFCRCGYRENPSYPPKYSEYLQDDTTWEYVSMSMRPINQLSNGQVCEYEFYLYNLDKEQQKDSEMQKL